MKRVDYYQCGFCSETGPMDRIDKHEKDCDEDPVKKRCGSCKHFEMGFDFGLYFREECRAGVDYDKISCIRIGDASCDKWQSK